MKTLQMQLTISIIVWTLLNHPELGKGKQKFKLFRLQLSSLRFTTTKIADKAVS